VVPVHPSYAGPLRLTMLPPPLSAIQTGLVGLIR